MPQPVFAVLRDIRTFERKRFPFLETLLDFDILIEVGVAQLRRRPLTLKELLVLGLGSAATVQRRLRRLRRLRVLRQRRNRKDRRVIELTVSPETLRLYEGYANWVIRDRRSVDRNHPRATKHG